MFDQYIIPVILGLVEGITEFLPVSSTGHLIIVNEFTGFTGSFAKMFDVVIQLGAIMAVAVLYRRRLFSFLTSKDSEERKRSFSIWMKAAVGVIPAFVFGFLFWKHIKAYLFNPYIVAAALVVGGVVLIIIEKTERKVMVTDMDKMDYRTAFVIGLIQCLAMVPGTSRSAATIIGAMMLGASRTVAAEFSFFLAIPTMVAASGYSLYKYGLVMGSTEMIQLAIGFIVSFVTAYLVIAAFIKFISKRDFMPFAYYRILLGAAVLVYFLVIR